MAGLKYNAVEKLTVSFEQVFSIPEETVADILSRQAKVIVDAIRAEAARLGPGYGGKPSKGKRPESARQRRGYATGTTSRAATVSSAEPDKTSGLTKVDVYFKGSRKNGKGKPRSNAAVAFFNEYGTRKVPARGFVRKAVASVDAAVTKIAEDGIDEWLKKHDL